MTESKAHPKCYAHFSGIFCSLMRTVLYFDSGFSRPIGIIRESFTDAYIVASPPRWIKNLLFFLNFQQDPHGHCLRLYWYRVFCYIEKLSLFKPWTNIVNIMVIMVAGIKLKLSKVFFHVLIDLTSPDFWYIFF